MSMAMVYDYIYSRNFSLLDELRIPNPVSLTENFTFLTIFSHFSTLSLTDDLAIVSALYSAEFVGLLSDF